MDDSRLSIFHFIVVVDPTDKVAYSVGSRYVLKTKGLDRVLNSLAKNLMRRRNAHKKHVEGPLCVSVVDKVTCNLGEECNEIHITSEGNRRRRPWCTSWKGNNSCCANVKEMKEPTSCVDHQHRSQVPVQFPPWCLPPCINHYTFSISSMQSCSHFNSPMAFYLMQSGAQFAPTTFLQPMQCIGSNFQCGLQNYLRASSCSPVAACTQSEKTNQKKVSSPTRAPSHSPTSTLGNSHYSSPSFTNSTYSSAHPSPPSSVHRPPPILALVIDTPNTTPATPTHPFVHSPYTSTPTQILESATLVPQRSRHSSFSNTNVSPLTTAV